MLSKLPCLQCHMEAVDVNWNLNSCSWYMQTKAAQSDYTMLHINIFVILYREKKWHSHSYIQDPPDYVHDNVTFCPLLSSYYIPVMRHYGHSVCCHNNLQITVPVNCLFHFLVLGLGRLFSSITLLPATSWNGVRVQYCFGFFLYTKKQKYKYKKYIYTVLWFLSSFFIYSNLLLHVNKIL